MASHSGGARAQARQDFREARKQAFVNAVHGVLSGEPTELLPFAEVQKRLGNRRYFDTGRYYERMKATWEEKPKKPTWGTVITEVQPNSLRMAGW